MVKTLSEALAKNIFIAATCDIWQDDYRRIPYLGVTIHYFNDQMQLCDQLIAIQPLDPTREKNAAYVKEVVCKALEEKGISFDPAKIIFVTDRGGNIKKALEDFIRLNCFPHFINNIVRESCKIDTIKNVLERCNCLVRYIKISGLNEEFKPTIKSAVITRFNSVLTMIESILLNWDRLNEILCQENEIGRISEISEAVLNQINSFLKPFKHWSDHTEKSKKPSLYMVWIGIDALIRHCSVQERDEHLVTLMKVKALYYIEEKFVLHKFHRISTFLNPNFKSLKFASSSLYERTVTDTRNMMQSIPDSNEASNLRRRSSFSSNSTVNSEISNYCNDVEIEDEIDKYVRWNHTTDLCIDLGPWWHQKMNEFPKLSKLAIAIHAIPASSTPSERVFSESGLIITERRVNLDPSAVEDILILRSESEKFKEKSIWNW